jgi:hypothetical protein
MSVIWLNAVLNRAAKAGPLWKEKSLPPIA